MGWVLLLMGVATFAPCILFPVWQSHRDLQLAQQLEGRRVAAMQSRVDDERRLLHALRNDPAVLARLARRDLGIKRNDDRWVKVDVPSETPLSQRVFNPRPDFDSVTVQAGSADPFDGHLAKVFHDARTRRVLMVMSIALMAVAVWIPNRRTSSP